MVHQRTWVIMGNHIWTWRQDMKCWLCLRVCTCVCVFLPVKWSFLTFPIPLSPSLFLSFSCSLSFWIPQGKYAKRKSRFKRSDGSTSSDTTSNSFVRQVRPPACLCNHSIAAWTSLLLESDVLSGAVPLRSLWPIICRNRNWKYQILGLGNMQFLNTLCYCQYSNITCQLLASLWTPDLDISVFSYLPTHLVQLFISLPPPP